MDINILIIDEQGKKLRSRRLYNVTHEDIDDVLNNVSLPLKRHYSRYELGEMCLGETKNISTDNPSNTASAVYMYARRNRKKFKCVTLTNNTLRVTRIR